jgi:hypothetical protein
MNNSARSDDAEERDDADDIAGSIELGARGGGGTNRDVGGEIGHNYVPETDNHYLRKDPCYVAGV